MNIIGISSFYHDSACCLLQDGNLVASVSEERFTRVRNDRRLPINAFRYCLEAGGNLNPSEIDCIAYYESPKKKLSRQLSMQRDSAQDSELFWLDPRRPEREIREHLGFTGKFLTFDHHLCHAASSYFYSGFHDAAILTVDGVGEWATTTFGMGREDRLSILEEVHFPDSLGLFYSTLTDFLGFAVLSDEYKVMGLAPYGNPLYLDQVRLLIHSENGAQFRLNRTYFDFSQKSRMFTDAMTDLFGIPQRVPESEILQIHKDIARSLQVVLEEVLLEKVNTLHERVPSKNLCLSGGVALNCVANRRIRADGPFQNLFVQPASGDAGSALGAAALAHLALSGNRHSYSRLEHVYLGPSYPSDQISQTLEAMGIPYLDYRTCEEKLLEAVVERLTEQKVIGWFQGRMEFGPRALGARSILADPRDPTMRDRLNELVKKREGFRPFAPAILESRVQGHMKALQPSPFMTETCEVRSPIHLPAITHVDGSARLQTVSPSTHHRFARLLEQFEARTGCPILVNTSFNVRGEPIVCSPEDAIRCMGNSQIDVLVLEDFIIDKASITPFFRKIVQTDYKTADLTENTHPPHPKLSGATERWIPADSSLPAGVYTFA